MPNVLNRFVASEFTTPRNSRSLIAFASDEIYFNVIGTFTATIAAEVSVDDGKSWTSLASFTSAGSYRVPPKPKDTARVRVHGFSKSGFTQAHLFTKPILV